MRISVASFISLLAFAALNAQVCCSEGSDLEIGGAGTEPGKFLELRDITFDRANNLYTLEGSRMDGKTLVGNCRVQKFDSKGKLLSAFSVRDEKGAEKNDPQRLAVDAGGNVYVTQPKLNAVHQFAPDGKLLKTIDLPGALGITATPSNIAVCGMRQAKVNNRNVWQAEQIVIIDAAGNAVSTVKLEKALENVQDLTCDRSGNFYFQAAVNQIYKFDSAGKLIKTIGSAESTRTEDGSELLHTVAVDSKDNIYSMMWGNPGRVTRFDAALTTVTHRGGQFKWGDPWSVHSGYAPMALDSNDRLWVGVTHRHNPDNPNFKRYHAAPAVVRTEASFLDLSKNDVKQGTTLLLGFKPSIRVALPHSIAYELKPISADFIVKASNRQIYDCSVVYRIHDMYRTEIATGKFDLKMQNGVESKETISFTPPRWGWYTISCEVLHKNQRLVAIGEHLGVTPAYQGMPTLDSESAGGWVDAQRHMFAGLPNMRLHVTKDLGALEKTVESAIKYGATFLVQFSDKKDCTPEIVREAVTRFKGRVKYWEIMNEPNFSMNTEQYVALVKELYPLIKSIDPEAKVMGPDVCGIDLNWYERFYKLGGKDFIDILSIHDYEGHESIDWVHWTWKFGALRKLMERNGDGQKPIWQTERAITGVRGNNFLGSAQAVRVLLHRDLLETLGIPSEHNNHYYLNEAGYSTVPSYLWSHSGPHPGALALRTRHAMIAGRTYKGKIDFGSSGDRIFMGLRYQNPEGSTVILRNLGTLTQNLDVNIAGAGDLEISDAFGNLETVTVKNGKASLKIAQMPLYVRLKPGQSLSVTPIEFGRNIASRATFSYSARTTGDAQWLTNGILEVIHAGHPNGGTSNPPIWTGDIPSGSQTLEIKLDQPRAISKAVFYSLHADNNYCALLDYDLQYLSGGKWVTLEEVRTPCPPSDLVETSLSQANTWYLDNNFFVHQFEPLTTDALRLVVHRTTHGFVPDERSRAWGNIMPQKLMLREIELFSPPGNAEISVASKSETPITEPRAMTVTVTNRGAATLEAKGKVSAPEGFKVLPNELIFKVEAGGSQTQTMTLTPPAELRAGESIIDAVLVDAANKTLDANWSSIKVPAPITISTQPVQAVATGPQPLRIVIKNPADRAVSGTATVSLSGPATIAPVEQNFGPVDGGKNATLEFKVPDLKLIGQAWKATFTLRANGVITTATQDLAVRSWSVIGPFVKDFQKDFGPEQGTDLSKTYKDQMGNEQKWQPATSNAVGYVDLNPLFKPNTEVCAYAVCYVKTNSACKVTFSAGSDDGGKAWLNGKLIMNDSGAHGASPGQFQAPVELQPGWNEVLFKIMQSNGGWGFYFELLGPDYKPMPGLIYAPHKN